ncbi:hypothetical protein LCGC14_2366150 [marine sediment metagenome]|uniref:Polysaccharide pyruvyl transferase domain-containing protein n=1 Tax=marine sediment metagenome TaxID=412755 RepID=A0A0F9CSF3_9ZZZZ
MLLNISYFEPIFKPLQGKKIGYIQNRDNIGGQIHQQGILQLFKKFKIQYNIFKVPKKDVKWDECFFKNTDEFVISGGGIMGKCLQTPQITLNIKNNYTLNIALHLRARIKALKTGKKVTILPQSFQGKEDLPYYKVFVRECISRQFYKGAILAPDLGLGFDYDNDVQEPILPQGIWLKTKTYEGIIYHKNNLGDPVDYCKTIKEYVDLAAKYKHIITDRCHFAIAGLLANQNSNYQRKITLVPNTYHKNWGLWLSWLHNLGVKWTNNIDEY